MSRDIISPIVVVTHLLAAACTTDSGGAAGASSTSEGSGSTSDTGASTDAATTGTGVSGAAQCTDSTTAVAPVEGTGAAQWTYTRNGEAGGRDSARAVAVDAEGRILVAGSEASLDGHGTMLLIALDAGGTELWRKSIPGTDAYLEAVVVDADGNIYVGGTANDEFSFSSSSIVRAFDADGGELWTYSDPPAGLDSISVLPDLVVSGGALYSVSFEALDDGGQLAVRRHELATGAVSWKTPSRQGTLMARPEAITAVGDRLITVGWARDSGIERPLIAVLTDGGALVSLEIEDSPDFVWLDVAPIGPDGDLVLVGGRTPQGAGLPDMVIRRIGSGCDEMWTRTLDFDLLYDHASSVAVGPGEAILVAGTAAWDVNTVTGDAVGARFAGDGTLLWVHRYDNPELHGDDSARAAAFAAGSALLAGWEEAPGEDWNVWVRRLAAE